jgi:hypothetical protein
MPVGCDHPLLICGKAPGAWSKLTNLPCTPNHHRKTSKHPAALNDPMRAEIVQMGFAVLRTKARVGPVETTVDMVPAELGQLTAGSTC